MLGVPVGQLRSWARSGLVEPRKGARGEYRFTFQDLVVLRTAKKLAAARIPPRRVRQALDRLKNRLPSGDTLTSLAIRAKGDHVVVQRDGALWDAESGQGELSFDAASSAPAESRESAAPDDAAGAGLADLAAHARGGPAASRDDEPVTDDDAIEALLADDKTHDADAEAWYELGFELESVSPEEAMRAYGQALERDPGHLDARINLGRLLLLTAQLNAAEMQFRLALVDGPNATALYNLGVTLEDLGRRAEAAQAYREAVHADGKCADAYFNLARLLEQEGDRHSALRLLKIYRKLTD